MLLQINKKIKNRIFICLCMNILLFIFIYNLPLESNHTLCIFKNITGKDCFNCGMTRAFLSIIHCQFEQAINYNWKVVFVFPYTIFIYSFSWYKYIKKSYVDKKYNK
ncbi:MAG: DUF2752 domain-containing protein [Clostridiales bacterium]|nr:DUF2752 domain-containing protein [Clostridiales bacterium]